jgi:acyl-CoA thioester hydrolase
MSGRPSPHRRDSYPHARVITTRWMDNDPYGHMNNAVHYSLFDTAVNTWLIEQGALDFRNGSVVGLVVETGLPLLRRARLSRAGYGGVARLARRAFERSL